jgi:hypothetical protein
MAIAAMQLTIATTMSDYATAAKHRMDIPGYAI